MRPWLTLLFHHWYIKMICLSLAGAVVFFYHSNVRYEEDFYVPLKILTNENYTFTGEIPSRVKLTLKGPTKEDLNEILASEISVTVDTTKITDAGVYNLPVKINRDTYFDKSRGIEIRVTPNKIPVTLETKLTKYLKVKAVISGIPAHGYKLDNYYINPEYVSVSGPWTHLSEINSIETEPVRFSGNTDDFSVRVKLNSTDKLLSFPEGNFVEFNGIIIQTKAVKTIENVSPEIIGLKESLMVEEEVVTTEVRVQGKLLTLDSFTKEDLIFRLDLSDITQPGIYTLPVIITTGRDFTVLKSSLEEVTLTIKEKP